MWTFCLFLLVVNTSASDCLERLVPEVIYCVSRGTLNSTHSLTLQVLVMSKWWCTTNVISTSAAFCQPLFERSFSLYLSAVIGRDQSPSFLAFTNEVVVCSSIVADLLGRVISSRVWHLFKNHCFAYIVPVVQKPGVQAVQWTGSSELLGAPSSYMSDKNEWNDTVAQCTHDLPYACRRGYLRTQKSIKTPPQIPLWVELTALPRPLAGGKGARCNPPSTLSALRASGLATEGP